MNTAVTCYVDGRRIEAECVNISAGGIFLRTANVATLPLDSTLAVSFRPADTSLSPHPIFVFGRAIYHREGTGPGIGIYWEKAVTGGSADELAAFLLETFQIVSAKVQHEDRIGPTPPHSVYRFEVALRAGATVHLRAAAPQAPRHAAIQAETGAAPAPTRPKPGRRRRQPGRCRRRSAYSAPDQAAGSAPRSLRTHPRPVRQAQTPVG